MKGALLPTLLACAALAGVGFVYFDRPDPPTRTVRESAPPDPAVAELRAEVARLEARVRELENAPAPEPRVIVPGEGEAGGTAAEPPRVEPRDRARPGGQLARLAESGEIGAVTPEQATRIETTVREARSKMLGALREIRNNPANEGLGREELAGLVRAEIEKLRAQVVADLGAIVPAADAQVIAERMLSARGDRRQRGRRGR